MCRGADGHDPCVPPPLLNRGPEVAPHARMITLPGDHERVVARHFAEAAEEFCQGLAEQHVRLQVEHGAELREVPYVHLEERVDQALLPPRHRPLAPPWNLHVGPLDDARFQLGHVLPQFLRSLRGDDHDGPLLVELPDAVDCSGQGGLVRHSPVQHECVGFRLPSLTGLASDHRLLVLANVYLRRAHDVLASDSLRRARNVLANGDLR
mmetsp:Transcript_73688/g.232726  ORF Transcript_73688/g.232726 Transcript_73688/m.232726 type:complete len:209 (-) Transcript_73688:208-834(-)